MSQIPVINIVTSIDYEVKEGVCDEIQQRVHAFVNRYRDKPAKILLGYGTYLSMCVQRSKFEHESKWRNTITFTEEQRNLIDNLKHDVIEYKEFLGIEIVIDFAFEHRIECLNLPNESLMRFATRAIRTAKEKESNPI